MIEILPREAVSRKKVPAVDSIATERGLITVVSSEICLKSTVRAFITVDIQ
ncbi:hypothetical protein [Ornithinibacillus halotolerans]|uniref:hypothetical protein n=1 Tax=Ornithinibacillus halotolerans TaxID=1274357 RepID=UPI001E54D91A|nr:hypothetical protein [Ornithinibacillus halotolerans]